MRLLSTSVRLLALVVTLALAACDSLLDAGLDTPTTAAMSLAFAPAEGPGGDAQAFDKADAAHVVLRRRSDGRLRYESTFDLAKTGGNRRATLELDVANDGERLDMALEVLADGAALFRGATTVTLRRNQVTPVDLSLTPVVSRIGVSPASIKLTALDDTVVLHAAALFATGDIVGAVHPELRTLDPAVASLSGTTLRAMAEGVTRVVARSGSVSTEVPVTVEPIVATVTVSPASDTMRIGGLVQLSAVARDANGHTLVRAATWHSSDASVVTVDGAGMAHALGTGHATVTAEAEGVEGTADITVEVAPGIVRVDPDTASFSMPVGGSPAPASRAITVSNVGGQTVDLSIATTYAPDVEPWLAATLDRTVVGAGASATLTLSVMPNGLAPGTYGAAVRLGDAATADTVDVTLTVEPVPMPMPNLVAGTPTVTPAAPTTNDAVSIDASITNVGDAASGTFSWRLLVDGTTVASGQRALAAGGQTTVQATGLGPYQAGAHAASLEVDYTGVVDESSEGDNTASTDFSVIAAPGVIEVDPDTASFSMPAGGSPTPASRAITVSNVGTRAVALSVATAYAPDVEPWLAATLDRTVVDANAPATLTLSVQPNSLEPGTYTAAVSVGDGTAGATVDVTLTVEPAPGPQLVAGTPTVTPAAPTTSDDVSIQAPIANVGDAASGTFSWRLLVDGTTVASGQTALAAGGRTTAQAAGLGPYQAGAHAVSLEVDYTGVVDESNEGDNTSSATFTVSTAPSSLAPVISDLSGRLLQLDDTVRCRKQRPHGSLYEFTFGYVDADGDVSPSGAVLSIDYRFDSGSGGELAQPPEPGLDVGGDGSAGTVGSYLCVLFGDADSVTQTFTLQDAAGHPGNSLTITVARPEGAKVLPHAGNVAGARPSPGHHEP